MHRYLFKDIVLNNECIYTRCYLRYAHIKDNLVYKDIHKYLFLNIVNINTK